MGSSPVLATIFHTSKQNSMTNEEFKDAIDGFNKSYIDFQNTMVSFLESVDINEISWENRINAAYLSINHHLNLNYVFVPKFVSQIEKSKPTPMQYNEDILEILNQCIVKNSNCVVLPDTKFDRATYMQVANALTGIGGKWDRKANGFLFKSDPTERLNEIQNGAKINLKKDFQFYETPQELADKIVSLAVVENTDKVLEPSGGQAAIIKALRRANKFCKIRTYELMEDNYKVLRTKENELDFEVVHCDFLGQVEKDSKKYDKIIANPPFTKNQDIEHVYAMFKCLKDGGKIVSVMSNHWRNSTNAKETNFREFIESVDAEIYEVDAKTFKESGTNIASCIVVINKK